jgi:WD40 repeat protein
VLARAAASLFRPGCLAMIRLSTKRSTYANLALVIFFLHAFIINSVAQRENAPRIITDLSDVVFAVSFSPDGSTLAIARGASDPAQRYGKIELWDTQTGSLRRVIKGFDGPVRSISFSPDGHTLVSGSSEYLTRIPLRTRAWLPLTRGELKWWDVQTGDLKHKLTLPSEHSYSLEAAYSPDGKQIALIESSYNYGFLQTNSRFDPTGLATPPPSRTIVPMEFFDSDLKLLDAQTGAVTFKLDRSRSGTFVFSPDGALMAKENGKEIRVWNVQTGREEHRLKGFKGAPNTIAFSPDGKYLAVSVTKYYREDAGKFIKVIGSSGVQVFDVRTWQMGLQLQNVGMVNSLAFEPAGRFLLIGGLIHEQEDATPGLKLWDLQSGKSASFHTSGADFSQAVDSLAISRNGSLVAFKSGPDVVQVLETQTWKVKYSFDKTSDPASERPASRFLLTLKRVTALGFSRDGNSVSGEIEGDGIKRWDPRTGEVKEHFSDRESGNAIVEVSEDGSKAAGIRDDGSIHVRDLMTGEERNLTGPGPTASALTLSPDGESLAVAYPNRIVLLSTVTGKLMRTIESRIANVSRIIFSADGRMVAAADENGAIETWDLGSGQAFPIITSAGKTTALRFAPGGLVLVSASEDGSVNLWDLRTGVLSSHLQKHSGAVNAIAFSSDGNLMATGGDDRTVIIWETAKGKARRTLKGHDLTVTSLAFSPDGSILASGCGNASVVLWNVSTGQFNRVLN